MNYVFNEAYIQGDQIVFWIYVISMIVIMLLTIVFVRKELKK